MSAELILGPMLRHVTQTSATIWVETDRPCLVEVLGDTTHTFCVDGHHYGLVIVEGLSPGTTTRYEVCLDGEQCWPMLSATHPASVIRTNSDAMSPRVLFGSCRTAAPHTPPWTLEMTIDPVGRGVDALYAYALRMIDEEPSEWPDLVVFLGDQIYADDSSPRTRARIAAARDGTAGDSLPPELVRGFEEFCWLYEESWSADTERWFLSVVPSVMIFDDHEMIDDWNISAAWVADIHREPWWDDHVFGGLMTYWLYQHLGNLSPSDIRDEGILDALLAADGDGHDILLQWARSTEEFTGGRDRYRFSFARDLGRVRLVVIDARNSRVLEPGHRRIIDATQWQWVVEACHADVDHLIIGSSLPAFVPGGLHDFQLWDAALCDGSRVGRRFGEWLRRTLDLEDWPAFGASFDQLVELIHDIGTADRANAPATISVLSGDIHFSYLSQIVYPREMDSRVHQIVNSPIRNALRPHERLAMRFSMSRAAIALGRVLRRSVRLRRASVQWRTDRGPVFENCLGRLDLHGRNATMLLEQSSPGDSGTQAELREVFTVDLVAGSRQAAPPRTAQHQPAISPSPSP